MLRYYNLNDQLLINELKKIGFLEINKEDDNLDVLFLNWERTKPEKVKNNEVEVAKKVIKQISLLEKNLKNKKIIIFDEYRTLDYKEYQSLKKYDVTFFEPYIRCREGFNYLPIGIKIKSLNELKLNEDNEERFGIINCGNINKYEKLFEKYYISEIYNDLKIYYNCDIKYKNDYEKLNISKINNFSFKDFKATVLLNTYQQNISGYLDKNFRLSLENNCIPLIPCENRYYQGFENTVKNSFDVWYYVKNYDLCYIGVLYQIYQDIKNIYPEMVIENVIEKIKDVIERSN